MLAFLLRRLAAAAVTLLALSMVTFGLGALAPGSPVDALLGEKADPHKVAVLRKQFHLDDPLPVRYAAWLGGCLRGDFGTSFARREPVGPAIVRRYPVTVRLGLLAALLAVLIGCPMGALCAVRAGTWIDRLGITLSLTGVSVPTFVSLPILVLIFSLGLRWFPVTYDNQDWQLLLPALALGARPAALLSRMTRLSLIEALSQDYVRTARAKGLSWATTLIRHAGKNALIPVLTVLGTSVGYLLGGSFVVESLFGIPGVGELSVSSIPARDYPVIQAVTLLGATVFIVINLLVDLLYGTLDPRLRAAGSA